MGQCHFDLKPHPHQHLNQLKDLKVTAVNLANNHIQDKGLVAIDETTRHLHSENIGFFGILGLIIITPGILIVALTKSKAKESFT